MRTRLLALVAGAGVILGVAIALPIVHLRDGSTPTASSLPAAAGLHISGNGLVDGRGSPVQLRGVNRSGTEYSCIHSAGIFDGPTDDASIRAIASWHVNTVRIPINEDCWLAINGAPSAYSGATYRQTIVDYVARLHKYGIYAELSLIWAAPGTYKATYQSGSPDEDHSPALWASLAATLRGDPDVILAPWGETIVDAGCFLNGGFCEATFGPSNTPYATAGMQQAVNVMRTAGYAGPIAIPGIDYANDLSQWLSHEPSDPLHQLVAEAHEYGGNSCSTPSCWDIQLLPVAQRVPLLTAELGGDYQGTDCSGNFTRTFTTWADLVGVSYELWAWDTWGTCSAAISDYGGTPYGNGVYYRAHLGSH
jgi:endoglucanase